VLRIVRSASLAVWATAHLRGHVRAAAVVSAVTGQDEPHRIRVATAEPTPVPVPVPAPGDLNELLTAAGLLSAHRFRLVLPVPGDVLGLPGPATFNQTAVRAGEAVVLESGSGTPLAGLVPDVTVFGSRWEPGALVTWTLYPVEAVTATSGTIVEADRELREAIIDAGSTLSGLDLVDMTGRAPSELSALRGDGYLPADVLPAQVDPRNVHVLATACRMRRLVDLAVRQGHGARAVDGRGDGTRTEALRRLDTVARRAVVTAINTSVNASVQS
jgi:hypothetical protein